MHIGNFPRCRSFAILMLVKVITNKAMTPDVVLYRWHPEDT